MLHHSCQILPWLENSLYLELTVVFFPAYLKLTVVVLLQGVQHEVEELSLSSRGHALKQSFIHGTCSLCVEVTDVNVT